MLASPWGYQIETVPCRAVPSVRPSAQIDKSSPVCTVPSPAFIHPTDLGFGYRRGMYRCAKGVKSEKGICGMNIKHRFNAS